MNWGWIRGELGVDKKWIRDGLGVIRGGLRAD